MPADQPTSCLGGINFSRGFGVPQLSLRKTRNHPRFLVVLKDPILRQVERLRLVVYRYHWYKIYFVYMSIIYISNESFQVKHNNYIEYLFFSIPRCSFSMFIFSKNNTDKSSFSPTYSEWKVRRLRRRNEPPWIGRFGGMGFQNGANWCMLFIWIRWV